MKDFFSKCDQIRRNLRIWSHLLKKSIMQNLIFCAVLGTILPLVVNNLDHVKKSSLQVNFQYGNRNILQCP